jgi:malonyl-CoA/methylmalonyl-CoA synthetase
MNAYSFFNPEPAATAERIFIETETGLRYRYADMREETARIANLLRSLGLQPGDRVAAQVDKSPQALFLYLACLRAGLCYLPLNTAYQREELAYFIGDAEPGLIVCAPEREALYAQICHTQCLSLNAEGRGSLSDRAAEQPDRFDDAQMGLDDLAVILYTSGTTGRSKGAMLTHGNLTSNADTLRRYWEIEADDVLLHALPLFHIHGLFVAIHPLILAGARIFFQSKFDASAVLRRLPDATLLMGVPTFYARLLQEPTLTREAVEHIRLFVSGSAPLLRETFDAWTQRTGHTILERYGMSESGMITSNPYRGERRGGTVGLPLPGVSVRIMDVNGRPTGIGKPGAIEIKGPNVFAGYWRMPEKTQEEFTSDEWFKTGDMGQWDADGYLSIVGRAKDLIITGGYNVYPKEIELALDALPGVVESAVIGLPHSDLGEAVTAIAVVVDERLQEAELIAQLRQNIAAYKVPKRIHFVRELPRNAMGKVQKNMLRKQYGI